MIYRAKDADAGRYSRRTTRAILSSHPRQLHAVNFRTTLSPGEFHSWRVSVRNLIDHQRRESPWWSGGTWNAITPLRVGSIGSATKKRDAGEVM
jgi:hypothetical protein